MRRSGEHGVLLLWWGDPGHGASALRRIAVGLNARDITIAWDNGAELANGEEPGVQLRKARPE